MDILYVVGNGSQNDNIELRYSLRSLEKFGKNVGRVCVAGMPPDWLSDEVETMYVRPISGIVAKNIFHNITVSVEQGLVSGNFILSADDHFYVRDVDFDNFPMYYIGELPTTISPKEGHVEYKMGLVFSRWILANNGLPTYMTSNHNSIPVSAESFSRYENIVEAGHTREYRINSWAVLGNMFIGMNPNWRKAVREYDVKICESLPSRKAILDEIGNEHCFSIGDGALDGEEMWRYLSEMFQEKSRWEK